MTLAEKIFLWYLANNENAKWTRIKKEKNKVGHNWYRMHTY